MNNILEILPIVESCYLIIVRFRNKYFNTLILLIKRFGIDNNEFQIMYKILSSAVVQLRLKYMYIFCPLLLTPY